MSQLSLTIEPVLDRTPALTLQDWMQRDPYYRSMLQPAGEQAIQGTIDPTALAGVLRLLRTWLELQRGRATARAALDGSEVTVDLDGDMDPQATTNGILTKLAPPDDAR